MDGGRSGWGLEGHGVIVTGAAQGIGEATARAFADVGARVCAVDLREDMVRAVVESLPGGPHQAAAMDLNDLEAHGALVSGAAAALGDVRAIVLAAGVLRREPFTEVSEEAWDWQVDTNLKATFFLSRAAGEHMRASGTPGSITHLHVDLGHDGWRQLGAGVRRLQGRRHRPHLRHGPSLRALRDPRQQHRARASSTRPCSAPASRRPRRPTSTARPWPARPTPSEVASVAVFLASAHASFVTGAIMNVSGGGWMG